MIELHLLTGFAVGAFAGFVVFTVLVLVGTWPGTSRTKHTQTILPGTRWVLPDGEKVNIIRVVGRTVFYGLTYRDGDERRWSAPVADFLALATPVVVPRPVSTAKAGDVSEVTP